jgi:adenosylhomocysteine nucleosidase
VSDGADEELGFSLDEFVDEEMKVRLWRVLKAVARKPRIIPQLLRLAGNVKQAGNNLTDALVRVLGDLPLRT